MGNCRLCGTTWVLCVVAPSDVDYGPYRCCPHLSKFERTSHTLLVNRINLVAGEFQNIAYCFRHCVLRTGGATTLWTSMTWIGRTTS
jgi:hypothetical protein